MPTQSFRIKAPPVGAVSLMVANSRHKNDIEVVLERRCCMMTNKGALINSRGSRVEVNASRPTTSRRLRLLEKSLLTISHSLT